MNANELANLLEVDSWYKLVTREEIATMLRAQAEKINNLEQWQKRQLDVIEAQKEYMKAQDEKIVDLAFKLAYAERNLEIVQEANTRSRP